MDDDTENLIDIEERAKKLSELTGRGYEDVLTDLLDDGKLNQSNTEDSADLVEQLKDAAELIATVQNISKDIQENTVLNGGENETKVEVTTTLEGDIVDRAIESVHRKVKNIKKIAIILIPIFLLLTGGTMQNMGMFNSSEQPNEYGACLNPAANNYDNGASWDDGSCLFGNPHVCDTDWQYDDYSSSNENEIYVRFTFFDENNCNGELEGHFIIILFNNGSSNGIPLQTHDTGIFRNNIDIQSDFIDLEEGTYDYEIEFHTIECDDGTCEHGDEFNSPHKPTFIIEAEEIEGCMDSDADNYDENATVDDGSCESQPDPMKEGCMDSNATNFDNLAEVDDGTCEYPPPRCEIVLFQISMQYNNTSAWVQYDLDCGTEPNDQDGYNVSVQFWNSENDTSLNYTIGYHYIKGYTADLQELSLVNLTAGKYDFHWIAIWTDDDGEQKLLEVNWSDIEITGV
jgi:hypothetical protein